MVAVMIQRPTLYPIWTVVMIALVGVGTVWFGFRDIVGY